MTKPLVLLFLILFSNLCFSQIIGDYYIAFLSDSTSERYRLKFIDDSTAELSFEPRHMSGRFSKIRKYSTTDSTIEILPEILTTADSLPLLLFRTNYFIYAAISLKKITGGFIDYRQSVVYVREKDLGKAPNLAFFIDGKRYIQKGVETTSYGTVKKAIKPKKALSKALKRIQKNIDDYHFEIVRGFNAYKRFGIKWVYGVIVITKKNSNN